MKRSAVVTVTGLVVMSFVGCSLVEVNARPCFLQASR